MYVPAQTLIFAPAGAAVTADWIVLYCAFGQLLESSGATISAPPGSLVLDVGPTPRSSVALTPSVDRSTSPGANGCVSEPIGKAADPLAVPSVGDGVPARAALAESASPAVQIARTTSDRRRKPASTTGLSF